MSPAQTRPDVVLILTDQWNPRMLGYAGNSVVRTPNIDALAQEGISFNAAYTQSPVCMPARCSLASGLYPHNHGHWMNFTGHQFPADQITLFRDVRAAGYHTAKIGKYHYFNLEWGEDYAQYKSYYDAIGLDWAQELPTPYMGPYLNNEYTRYLQSKGLLDPYMADIANRFEKGDFDVVAPSPLSPDDHQDGYITRQALAHIDRCATEIPLFLCVSLPGPHTPFDAPGHYATLFGPEEMTLPPNMPEAYTATERAHWRRAQANYFGKLAHLDDRIGQIVDALKVRGNWENTLFIFAADHGEYLGSHGRKGKGGFEEESARVPMFMRWPGHIPAAQKSDALVEWIDLNATIVDAVGGMQSPERFGVSLLPLARAEVDAVHDAVFSEIGRGEHLNYMVRTEKYKWLVQNGHEHLYDITADPFEMNDLSALPEYQSVLLAHRDRLRTFLMETQVNVSAGYQPLFTRIGIQAEHREGMADRLMQMFRKVHEQG